MLSLDDVPFPGPSEWVRGLVEGRRGELVQRKRSRAVWRVEEDGRVWFAKRGGPGKGRELSREAAWIERLGGAGVPVARLLAAGRDDGAFWVVTEPAPGRPLSDAVSESVARGDVAALRRVLAAAAALARRLHGAGFRLPDLSPAHVFVAEGGGGAHATLIDVARAAAPRGGPRLRHVAEDLAALLFPLPLAVPRTARARLLRDATGLRGDELRALGRAVDAALAALALRTRWRHRHADVSPAVAAAVSSLRGDAGATPYDALLEGRGMTVLRTLPDRENRCFEAAGRRYFMKTYPPTSAGWSPALCELRGILRFQRAGVPVCRAEAYGEDISRGSFVVVRGCCGEPLDDLLRRGATRRERRVLARELGVVFRRMRAARLRHRDAYPCHVFTERLSPAATGEPRFALRLIDLTRAGRAPRPRERWYVKDAAQLWHGLPKTVVSRTDAVRFLRAVFDVPRLDARVKRFARRVAAKEARIRARQDRHAQRRGDG